MPTDEPLTVIAVDPGHDILVDAIRQHVPGHNIPIVVNGMQRECTKAWRRQQLQTKLAEMGRSHFSLTNRHWHAMCGHKRARQLDLNLRAKMGLQPVIDRLSNVPSRVQTQEAYKAHLVVRLAAIGAMRMRAQAKAPRRWNFDCYRKEQLAVKKLSEDLLTGCSGKTVIVWGNGGFGPTSRRHAAAPNKYAFQVCADSAHI